jgi:CxxC motif-containing protein
MVVKAANEFTAKLPVKIGDVLIENVVNGINLVSSSVVDR